MIGTTRLPLHPRPLPYEALSSWVDRLAAAYDLDRYEFLRAIFGADASPDTADLDGGTRPDLIATFADRTGLSPERVRAMTLAGYTPELIDTAVPSAGLFETYCPPSLTLSRLFESMARQREDGADSWPRERSP